jgi:hypothetical protein
MTVSAHCPLVQASGYELEKRRCKHGQDHIWIPRVAHDPSQRQSYAATARRWCSHVIEGLRDVHRRTGRVQQRQDGGSGPPVLGASWGTSAKLLSAPRLQAMRQGRPRWLRRNNMFYYPRTTRLSGCSFGLACCIVRKHPGVSSFGGAR